VACHFSSLPVLPSIAVLPFDAIGLGKDRSLYGEGIGEDIINNLTYRDFEAFSLSPVTRLLLARGVRG
jgi:TolB-like protein